MARDLILMEDVHFLTISIGKNVIVFRIDMSSSVYIDKKGVTLIFGKGTTQGLDGTRFTAEAKYPIYFTQSEKRFVLSLHNERTVFCLLMVQKYISSKQNTQK